MDETKAIALCLRHRDPIGFEFLVRKYQREALMHAAALLGNRDDAAEACQESFTSAFASLARLPELTAFYPWFYRILRNRCLNMLARRKTAASYARREMQLGEETGASAESAASRDEERAKIWRALGSLTLEHREVLALRFMRGYDYDTLAALLGVPRGTIMSRLYHARRAFQAAYTMLGGGELGTEGERNHDDV
jgi:RNA polymerase sigma-70 factor (ECF subfamily)